MIQRRQTLFLLLSLIAMSAVFFLPLGTIFSTEASLYELKVMGIYNIGPDNFSLFSSLLPLSIFYFICIALQLITVFLYKKRVLQMRISILNAILFAGFTGLAFFYLYQATHGISDAKYSLGISFIIPVCASILNIIAYRFILRDELLIKSLDRIR